MPDSIFGTENARKVLLFLQNYGEGYGRQIAATFDMALLQVQRQLKNLEQEGWLVSRSQGRTRMFTWNPANPKVPALRAFLQAELDTLPEREIQAYFRQRRRPRRSGKPI